MRCSGDALSVRWDTTVNLWPKACKNGTALLSVSRGRSRESAETHSETFMAHRKYLDRKGRAWDVWTVFPTRIERRSGVFTAVDDSGESEAPDAPDAPDANEGREERRRNKQHRATLGPLLADGWLCFQCKTEKRRLAPIPDGWDLLLDDDLEALCKVAVRSDIPVRRLVE